MVHIGAVYCKISLYHFICVLMFVFYSLLCNHSYIRTFVAVAYDDAVFIYVVEAAVLPYVQSSLYFPC